MTISFLQKKFSTPSLTYAFLVSSNKVGGIVRVLDIIPLVSLGVIPSLANQIFNCMAFIFFYSSFLKQRVYFIGLESIRIVVDIDGRGYLKVEMIEKIPSQYRGRLQLGQGEHEVNFLITRYIQLIGKTTYLFLDPKRVYVLLYKFFHNFHRRRDEIAFVKAKHGLVFYFHKHWLMLPIIIGFLLSEGK